MTLGLPSLLLVEPPLRHPAAFTAAYGQACAALRQMGVHVHPYHSSSDYWAYLMAPDALALFQAKARRRIHTGLPEKMDGPALLRSDTFFDPSAAAMLLHHIDQALALVSLACAPVVLDRRGFSHPGLNHEADLLRWLADTENNPFAHFAESGCRPPIPLAQCERIMFVVDAPGQLPGALALAQAWRRRAPRAAMAVCAADAQLQACAETLLAQAVPSSDAPKLTAWVSGAHQAMASFSSDPAQPPDAPALLRPAAAAAAAHASLHAGRLEAAAMKAFLDSQSGGDGQTVVWQDPQGEPRELGALLFQVAKRGFWNHVILPESADASLVDALAGFAAVNPNIIHSWCRRTAASSRFSDARDLYPDGNPPYGPTRPLPGLPLWQRLQDPLYLNAYAARHGAGTLARMFLMDEGRRPHLIGSRLEYHFLPPQQLPPGYLDEVVRMVEAGGSVQTQWVRHNLERAFLIAFVEENGVIVGNSSLKHPRREYIEAVSRQTGIDLRQYLERGYTSVRPEYRSMGIGARLLEGLTQRAGEYKIFSIIAEDNVATQKMAIRNRTRRVAAFHSERSGKTIGVWIPEWMLPEGMVLPPQPDLA